MTTIKHSSVMHHHEDLDDATPGSPDMVGFVNLTEEEFDQEDINEDAQVSGYLIRRDLWEQMGSPAVVTVTVEPDDKLNEPPVPAYNPGIRLR